MKLFIKLLIITSLLLLSACFNIEEIKKKPVKQQMEIANELYKTKEYKKARDIYESVTFMRSSKYTSDAHFKLADCYFQLEDYSSARIEYEQIKSVFPDYDKIGEVYFRIALCYFNESDSYHYSQEETLLALDAFEEFIEKFPFSDKKSEAFKFINDSNMKLLKKKYTNGYIYYKISDYSASLFYFDEIIKLGNKNDLDKKSLYYSTLIYIARKDKDNAQEFFNKLETKYPESKEASKAKDALSELL